MEKVGIDINSVRIEPLNPLHKLDAFDCGDDDINDFLKNDALIGQEAYSSRTHLFIYDDKVIGFITSCCDSIKLKLKEKEGHEGLSSKRYQEFPAVKIARLGVSKEFQKKGIGSMIIDWGKGFILKTIVPKIGCRFITLDAYPGRSEWYIKKEFKKNTHNDYVKRNTISMRMDIFNPKK